MKKIFMNVTGLDNIAKATKAVEHQKININDTTEPKNIEKIINKIVQS